MRHCRGARRWSTDPLRAAAPRLPGVGGVAQPSCRVHLPLLHRRRRAAPLLLRRRRHRQLSAMRISPAAAPINLFLPFPLLLSPSGLHPPCALRVSYRSSLFPLVHPCTLPDVDPHRSDIVVLSPHDHSISVYQGQHLLITLKPFALPSPPLSLSHPVGSRLSLHTATNSYRVHLAQAVHSPLVHCCFSALAYALPVQGMLGLKTDWLATRERQRTSEEVGDAVASEWRVFAPLLLELLSPAPPSLSSASTAQPQRELSPPLPPASAMSQMSASPSRKSSRHTRQISTSPPPPHRAADADAWSLLVASNHHRQWSRHPVLAHLTASVDIPTPTPSASAHDPKRQKTSATVSASLSLSSRELLQPHAAAVLLALHLTYEGFKLDQLHHCHLHPLATLCHGIAVRSCAAEWCDAYQRDWPELITHRPVGVGSSSLSAATLTSPPPSIFRWLHHRLSGDPRGVERFPIPQASLADPHSPFELLRRICECYELMTQPVLARSSYAQPGEDDRLQGLSDPTGGSRRSAAQTPSALRSHGRPSSSRLSQATPLSSLSSSTRSDRSITIDTHPLFSPSPTPPVRRTTRPSPDRLLSSSSSSAALVLSSVVLLWPRRCRGCPSVCLLLCTACCWTVDRSHRPPCCPRHSTSSAVQTSPA